jgi:hypothetical protein
MLSDPVSYEKALALDVEGTSWRYMAAGVGGRHVRSEGVDVLGIAPVCFDASKAQWPRKLAYALGCGWTGVGARLDVMINSVEWSLVIAGGWCVKNGRWRGL